MNPRQADDGKDVQDLLRLLEHVAYQLDGKDCSGKGYMSNWKPLRKSFASHETYPTKPLSLFWDRISRGCAVLWPACGWMAMIRHGRQSQQPFLTGGGRPVGRLGKLILGMLNL